MRDQTEKLDHEIEELLRVVAQPTPRTTLATERGRAKFLAEARKMKSAVSISKEPRHKGWKVNLIWKEQKPMTTLTTLLIAITMIFGGVGATVFAAQESQPADLLYPVKLASEDVRLNIAFDTPTNLQLSLRYAERRIEEMHLQLNTGESLADSTLSRWQKEMQRAFQLVEGMPPAEYPVAVEQIRASIQRQNRLMDAIPATPSGDQDRLRIRQMLETHLHTADALDKARQNQIQQKPGSEMSSQTPGINPTPSCTGSKSSFGPGGQNPWTTGTPTPGSSYGPGGQNPWTTGTPTPGSSYGPGGQNPWTTGTPTPGSSYGPGPEQPQPTNQQNPNPQPGGPQPGPNPNPEPNINPNPNPGPNPGGGKGQP